VHARDVIDKLLKANASSPSDFEWASQLRFYWDRDANDAVVKQVGWHAQQQLGSRGKLCLLAIEGCCFVGLLVACN
jgi:dynein heavy chain